jgi:hypothetical protein
MTTPDSPVPSLEERVAKLDRLQRRLYAVVMMLVLGIVALLAWQFYPSTRPVESQRFTMRDKHGIRRIDLTLTEQGEPMFRLNDKNGKARAMIWLRDDGAVSLRLSDNEGQPRLSLNVRSGGSPEVVLNNRDGRSAASVSVDENGLGGITVRDIQMRTLWSSPEH